MKPRASLIWESCWRFDIQARFANPPVNVADLQFQMKTTYSSVVVLAEWCFQPLLNPETYWVWTHNNQNLLKKNKNKKEDWHEHHMNRNHPRLSGTQAQQAVAGRKGMWYVKHYRCWDLAAPPSSEVIAKEVCN